MCGIAGLAGFKNDQLLEQMTNRMTHRGPDDVGYFILPSAGLGCRRLSIIDLAGGHQPMANTSRTVAVVQNGEIYNYRELREELRQAGRRFETQSDTEVILRAYEEFGTGFCSRLNGDFAIAIWDEKLRTLLLARDRMGVHPLYFTQRGDELVFASELKSLLCWSKTPRQIDPEAVDRYLTLRYIPQGNTLFSGIRKLPPACLMEFKEGRTSIHPYWRISDSSSKQFAQESPAALEEQLTHLFEDSVRLRMRSDVPVGAYLSGGVDSSMVVALMSKLAPDRVETFSIGFGTERDELKTARETAKIFNTRHHEMTVGKRDFEHLPKILWHLDEPLGDAIIIPTFQLSKEASRHVKVVLSGEGADEVWGGYVHHLAIRSSETLRKWPIPASLLRWTGARVSRMPQRWANRLFPYPGTLGNRGKEILGEWIGAVPKASSRAEYRLLASVFRSAEKEQLYTADFRQTLNAAKDPWETLDGSGLDSVMRWDMENWLPDYTLLKQDKLGLAHSVEVRVPHLDHRLVELSARSPVSQKIFGLTTKRVLRKAAARMLPPEISRRPKQAFLFPYEKVFGDPFDNYVRDLLGSDRCKQRGIFSSAYLQKRLRKVRGTELLESKQLFALLVLEIWFRVFVDGEETGESSYSEACGRATGGCR